MTELDRNVAIDAYNVTENLSAQEAIAAVEKALYETWVKSETVEDREKLHGIAVGTRMFWETMLSYARTGKMHVEGLSERQEAAIRAID